MFKRMPSLPEHIRYYTSYINIKVQYKIIIDNVNINIHNNKL